MGGGWVREGGGKKTWVPDGVFPPPSCICVDSVSQALLLSVLWTITQGGKRSAGYCGPYSASYADGLILHRDDTFFAGLEIVLTVKNISIDRYHS
jgi:hypothetical protein